jgi:hypothetical protein
VFSTKDIVTGGVKEWGVVTDELDLDGRSNGGASGLVGIEAEPPPPAPPPTSTSCKPSLREAREKKRNLPTIDLRIISVEKEKKKTHIRGTWDGRRRRGRIESDDGVDGQRSSAGGGWAAAPDADESRPLPGLQRQWSKAAEASEAVEPASQDAEAMGRGASWARGRGGGELCSCGGGGGELGKIGGGGSELGETGISSPRSRNYDGKKTR